MSRVIRVFAFEFFSVKISCSSCAVILSPLGRQNPAQSFSSSENVTKKKKEKRKGKRRHEVVRYLLMLEFNGYTVDSCSLSDMQCALSFFFFSLSLSLSLLYLPNQQ